MCLYFIAMSYSHNYIDAVGKAILSSFVQKLRVTRAFLNRLDINLSHNNDETIATRKSVVPPIALRNSGGLFSLVVLMNLNQKHRNNVNQRYTSTSLSNVAY